jgi:hypothetical protein
MVVFKEKEDISMNDRQVIRVVQFREGPWLVAQCLEVDIAAQAKTENDLLYQLSRLLVGRSWRARSSELIPSLRCLQLRKDTGTCTPKSPLRWPLHGRINPRCWLGGGMATKAHVVLESEEYERLEACGSTRDLCPSLDPRSRSGSLSIAL